MKNVNYQNEGLLLYIPTLSPESMHTGLMQGIIQTVKYSLTHPEDVPDQVKQANIFLLDLLSSMLPEEQQIEQLYKC
ncbi:hypothetical protein CLV59_109138 [Chitinophaga dinghuensis]|uniref:Uncharacterized protein n=1 Tax=Chitinophaga dinghuensis TaxID=1539050 RepID=A0A327VL85_9BACT|nr:hypothetical protein [Chitinophaga dinghuensis]RAJ75524.1 hypothetical protein CLV59_109138 [Chitinophaga dinghuensis]